MKTIANCEYTLTEAGYQKTQKKNQKNKIETENLHLHCIESINWVGGVVDCSDAAVWFNKWVLALKCKDK